MVVNEFGALDIDSALVVGADDDVVQLRNGCVCCSVRGDLLQTMLGLLQRRKRRFFGRVRFDRVVIEASGLASPGPVVQTFALDAVLRDETRVDGIVTLAHAGLIAAQLTEHPEAADQVGYADVLVLNHADRVDAEGLEEAQTALRNANALAPIHTTRHAELAVPPLLAVGGTDPAHWALAEANPHAAHTEGVSTVALTTEAPVDLHRLKMWLQFLSSHPAHDILRIKGILRCSGHTPAVVVQAVHQWLELGPAELPAPEASRVVIIGRALDADEVRRGWAAVVGA